VSVSEALERVRLVVTDVDGVLTNGAIVIHHDGTESKVFNVKDGSGIKYLMRNGVQTAIISARECAPVEQRARELGIPHCVTGALDKLPAYQDLLAKTGLADADVCYIGDDLPDIPPMRRAGFAVAVADAVDEVKAVAAHVTRATGGHGALRELAEMILKAQGKWAGVMERYLS